MSEVLAGLPPEIEQYRQLIKSRLRWHTRFVHGYSMPYHQLIWAEALEDQSIKRLLIIAPPKWGKSPVIGDYLGWRIGSDPEGYHCIYVSNTATQANKYSVALRDTIAYNKNYRFLYNVNPDVNKGWGENEWFIKRKNEADKDPTLQATGVGGPVLGGTVQEVVFDDICVDSETPIWTEGGLSAAGEVSVGQCVMGQDGKLHRVTRVSHRRVRDCMAIRPVYCPDSYIVTPEHRLLVGRGQFRRKKIKSADWVCARDLNKNDYLSFPVPQLSSPDLDNEWENILKVKVSVGQHKGLEQKNYLNHPLFWRLVGYWLAKGDSGRGYVRFSFNVKESWPIDIEEISRSVLNRKATRTPGPRNSTTVIITDKRLSLWLQGQFRKKGMKRCPMWVLGLPLSYLAELIKGYFRGDGNKSVRGGFTFASISYELLAQVQLMLMRFGILGGIGGYIQSGTSFKSNNRAYKLRCGPDLSALITGMAKEAPRRVYGCFRNNQVLVPIKSLKMIKDEREVVNLTVADASSYCSPLMVSHNCDAENMATEYQRQKLMEWIRTTAMSRLVPGGRAVAIMTRWHENDPAAEFEKDGWVVLSIPAIENPLYTEQDGKLIIADGELTYPGFWTLDALNERLNDLGFRGFEMMFQRNVASMAGGIFERQWWRYWKQGEAPWQLEGERNMPVTGVVQSWDTGFKEKTSNDYSVGTTWNVLANGFYLVDMYRNRVGFPELKRAANAVYEQYRPMAVLIEDAASGQCYSSDTEILTKRGWLCFPNVNIDSDEFATRNIVTTEFEWQKATARLDKDYAGPMIHFHSRPIDLLVTPDHRMLVTSLPRKLGGNSYRKGDVIVEANELVGYKSGSHISIPMISIWHGVEIGDKVFHADKAIMANRYGKRLDTLGRRISPREIKPIFMTGDEYCAFMGMYLSEGWYRIDFANRNYDVFISQRKQNTKAFRAFQTMLSSIIKREVHYDNDGFIICSLGLAEYVAQFGNDAYDKYVPDEIINATPQQLSLFWDYYMLGDGGQNLRDITTVSPRIAGQLVEIAQKMGFSASTYKKKRPSKPVLIGRNKLSTPPENFRQVYKIGLRRSRAMSFSADEVYYVGMIHCVSVPNGIVYVRRNGKPAWCGQSLLQELRSNTRIPVIAVPVDRDKVARANAVTPLFEAGKVFLPEHVPWRAVFEHEFETFPKGTHDDIVDSVTQFLNWARIHVVTGTEGLTGVGKQSIWRRDEA